MILQFSNYLVGNIDNIDRSVRLPVCFLVSSLHKKSDVVHKTIQNFLLLLCTLHHPQKLTCHVLTTLTSIAELKLTTVVNLFIQDGLLQLFHTVVVGDRRIVIVVLSDLENTFVGRRGRPRALSVLGLIRAPGGLPSCFCLTWVKRAG